MSIEKYILSICWIDNRQEIHSKPFGIFNTMAETIQFAEDKIDEIKDEYIQEYDEDYINEHLFFNFTIESIFI